MKVNLSEVRQRTVSVNYYMSNIKEPFREKFLERKKTYKLNTDILGRLRNFANDYLIVAFSAEWCKDCAANIPILALISEITGLEVRVFGGLKRNPLSQDKKWSVPPSPPEVETFCVDKIPYILVFDKKGEKVGEIVENPEKGLTLEEEILKIVLGNVKGS
ncbi:MAG: thioredoxin family protein [Candidatus Bathyarchaeia archaeon]